MTDDKAPWARRAPRSTGSYANGLVSPDDPAVYEIMHGAQVLREFGFDPRNPDVARRAVEWGRRQYRTRAAPAYDAETSVRQAAEQRDAEVASGGCVVYYMRVGNRVKIGWTSNLRRRLDAVAPEELLASEPGGIKVEAQRHREFRHLRTHREWFRAEESLMSHVRAIRSASVTADS